MIFAAGNRIRIAALSILLISSLTACQPTEKGNLKECTFAWLDEVRDQRSLQIREHFDRVNTAALEIVKDPGMLELFHEYRVGTRESARGNPVPDDLSHTIDAHYVHRYGNFYDILFVDREGFVFFSIKREMDYHTNLFTGRLGDTRLATSMHDHPFNTLVDFEVYPPSGEPAAFFVVPVVEKGDLTGWFVLQYASNALNSLLTDREKLGRTGEVYLVNHQHQMLSDSRFVNDSTVLGLVVDHDAVRRAFSLGEGHTITEDYRGVRVFSSFCSFEYFETSWAMLVEIDEDEILSRHFSENADELLPGLCSLAASAHTPVPSATGNRNLFEGSMRVDVGELRRVEDGGLLFTAGVGPCTAVIVHFADRFGYLVHLAPTDAVYPHDALSSAFLGKQQTRFLDELTQRITKYDIRLSELSQVRFVIAATHTRSIRRICEQLLAIGVELAQIEFLFNPSADYSNVFFDQDTGTIEIQWVESDKSVSNWLIRPGQGKTDLGSLLKQQLKYDDM